MILFKVLFDDPNASYFAGQAVQGKILLHLSKPKKIKALKLRCSGRAEVHWTTGSGKHKKSRDANEPYFEFDRVLLGEETQDIILPVGENVFPFHIQLPPGIPSSFEGAHGNVQYFIRATMTRPWELSRNVSSYFTVNGFVDLNLFGHASRALTARKRANDDSFSVLDCLRFHHETVEFHLTLDRTGFVPGDTVRFSLTATNESSNRVSAIVLELVHVATYRDASRRHEKSERKVVATVRGPGVDCKRTITWNSDSQEPGAGLKIPAIPPTNLGGGSIISLQYDLVVTIKMATLFHTKIEGKVPVIIGTVPYRTFFEELMPETFVARQPAVSNSGEPAPSTALSQPISVRQLDINCPPPTYADIPAPPTYAEAMELYSLYGTHTPSAPPVESPENQLESEGDEAGYGRPFNPRYAAYEWDRFPKRTV